MVVSGWGIVLTVIALTAARHLNLRSQSGRCVDGGCVQRRCGLGGGDEPGSMLNSRPVNGGRWYGFGNVTFAVYASATLIVLGYLGHRLHMAGSRHITQSRSPWSASASWSVTVGPRWGRTLAECSL